MARWSLLLLRLVAVGACGTAVPSEGQRPDAEKAGAGGTAVPGGTDASTGLGDSGRVDGAGGHAGNATSAGVGGNAGAVNVGGGGNTGAGTTTTGDASGGAGGRAAGGSAGAVGDGGMPTAVRCGRQRNLMWRGTFDAGWTPSTWSLGVKFESGKTGRTEVVDDASGQFGKVLRVHYDAGVSDQGGAEFRGPIPGLPADSACFSYWVRFDSTFAWVKGGKLPGLCAGACFSGGNPSDGVNGWSMRYMWRSGGAGEGYAYITPPGSGDFGTQLGLGSFTFTVAKWHHMEEELDLNTPGRADGVLKVWFDRDSGIAPPNHQSVSLTYRTVANAQTRIGLLFFSTFFGGNGADWAPPVSTFADFAMFELFE